MIWPDVFESSCAENANFSLPGLHHLIWLRPTHSRGTVSSSAASRLLSNFYDATLVGFT